MICNLNIEGILREIREDIVQCELLEDDKAERVAEIVLAGLRRRYGGTELYIPADYANKYPSKAILQAYGKGDSVRAICKRFGISNDTFYRILHSA